MKLYAAHPCSILCYTYRNTNFSNSKIKRKKKMFWEAFFVTSSVPARNYLFKVSNWNTRIRCENYSRLRMKTLARSQWRHSIPVSLLLTVKIFQSLFSLLSCWNLNRETFAGFILWRQTLLKTRSGISCVILQYFKCKQNLLRNGIWAYTIATLLVNQWEIFQEFTSDVDSG